MAVLFWIRLDQICPKWIKLDQIGFLTDVRRTFQLDHRDWIKSDQIGSKRISLIFFFKSDKIVQIGSNWFNCAYLSRSDHCLK